MLAVPPEVLRARRTAAGARALMAVCGMVALLTEHDLTSVPIAAFAGFTVILVTAAVQLRTPGADWLKVEESLAPVAGVLIIGLGSEQVTIVTLLWLGAVASGVLARGGRVYWVGRTVLLISLLLPIVRLATVSVTYGAFCLSAIALLLTCGRVTEELRAIGARARHDADHDGLTGALSRTAFRACLERVAGACTAEDRAAVMMLDLESFGAINKASGHAAGDQALVSVVPRIQAAIGEGGIVGRLGGDEFAAVFSGTDPRAAAQRLLDDLAAGDSQLPALTASVGIAMIPEHGRDAETLLRTVDVALRVAKRMGRHQLSVYAGEPLSAGPGGAAATLRRLIAGDGLEMAVQPIVAIRDGRVHAYEALARFQARTTSSPLYWFELANELGLRDELELACLREALGLLGRRPPGTLLSVNLSGSLLLDPRTSELLAGRADRDGLILELTENSLLEDTPGVHARDREAAARRRPDRSRRHGRRILRAAPGHDGAPDLPEARSLADQRDRRRPRPRGPGDRAARLCPPDRRPPGRRGRGDGRRARDPPCARRGARPGLPAGPPRPAVAGGELGELRGPEAARHATRP